MSNPVGDVGGWAVEVMDALGYAGVGLLVALETVFPPIPSEVILPLAGFLTGQGRLTYVGVVAAATGGSVVGALILYGLGYWLGEARLRGSVRRFGRVLFVKEADLARAQVWFDRHGGKAVLLGRMVPFEAGFDLRLRPLRGRLPAAAHASEHRGRSWDAAISSRQRPSRSSFSSAGRIPNVSSTAQASAHGTLSSSGRGAVSRLATSASTTCPFVRCATARTGASASTRSLTCSRGRRPAGSGDGWRGANCRQTSPSRPEFAKKPARPTISRGGVGPAPSSHRHTDPNPDRRPTRSRGEGRLSYRKLEGHEDAGCGHPEPADPR